MSVARRLRVVRPHPSVIVDAERGQPMTPPWTREDLESTPAIPHDVKVGMWIAAWARAEHCGLEIRRGCLEPRCRFEPSQDLFAALGASMGSVIGSLFFAVPLMYREDEPHAAGARGRAAWAASWPYGGHGAPMGRS